MMQDGENSLANISNDMTTHNETAKHEQSPLKNKRSGLVSGQSSASLIKRPSFKNRITNKGLN